MEKPKILIVEDESIIAEDISESLRRLGYENTRIADSGKRAIETAVEMQPDLILMDIKLKGKMDGIEAIQQIYSRIRVPVVYLTANADCATIERAKITEPFGYLVKPYKEAELQSTIEVAVFKNKMEDGLRRSER